MHKPLANTLFAVGLVFSPILLAYPALAEEVVVEQPVNYQALIDAAFADYYTAMESVGWQIADQEAFSAGVGVAQTTLNTLTSLMSQQAAPSEIEAAYQAWHTAHYALIAIVTGEPIPSPEPSPEPSPVEPSPEPAPVEPEQPVEPTPQPEPSPEPPVAPEPQPEPNPSPEPQPTPEPEPTSPSDPSEPEVVEPEQPVQPEPVIPEPKPSPSPTPIPVEPEPTPTQPTAEEMKEEALLVLETAEKGSPEYLEALQKLFEAAQADDIPLPAEIASIPLLGPIAGQILDAFNHLGNVGADMAPEQRERSEEVIVAAVIAGQVAQVASAGAAAAIRRKP